MFDMHVPSTLFGYDPEPLLPRPHLLKPIPLCNAVAFDSRLTVRQMVRDVARLATTVLRTAVQGPPATADEAAYPEGFLPLLFGMTPEVRASFSMALST